MRFASLFFVFSLLFFTGCSGGTNSGAASSHSVADEDKECEEYLKEPLAAEAKKWLSKSNAMLFKGDRAEVLKMIDKFYAAGATKVTASPNDLQGKEICELFIVTLPEDPEARKKVFAVEAEYYKVGGAAEDASKDEGQKYLRYTPE